MEPHDVSAIVGTWGYAALFVLFLATGVGSPVPEDLLLIATGYLVFAGALEWPMASVVAIVGVIGSDFILFVAGRQLAWHASRLGEGHFLSPDRLSRATQWFDRVGDRLILLARLAPGTRAVVFLTAGLRSVPTGRFLAYDSVGALIWVPVMLLLGQTAGPQIGDLTTVIQQLQDGAFWSVMAGATIVVLWLTLGREESKL